MLRDDFPNLFARSTKKNRTVAVALHHDTWIRDLRHGNADPILPQFISLWRRIRGAGIRLQVSVADEIVWTAGGGAEYSARAAYDM